MIGTLPTLFLSHHREQRLHNSVMQPQGGEAALQAVVLRFGPQLPTAAPQVMDLIDSGLASTSPVGVLDAQAAMASLQALRSELDAACLFSSRKRNNYFVFLLSESRILRDPDLL
jgi:hypothetical protein